MKRLELRPVGLDDVDLEPPGARLGHHPLEQVFRRRAPDDGLHAVLLLERGRDDLHVLDGHRGVDRDGALALRAIDQALIYALTTDAGASRENRPFSPEDLRAGSDQIVDGVLISIASVPGWLVRRLDAAFDEVLSSVRA